MNDRTEVQDLKARVDLVEVIRQSGVVLKKVGKTYKGLCPFHVEDTPSFCVTPEVQLFKCHGCQAGGDLLRFLQLKEELTFPQALQRARELAGELPPSPARPVASPLPGQESLPGELDRSQLLADVARRYAEGLRSSEPARAYLASRGLGDPDLWTAFGLGYADGRLLEAVPEKGEVRQALEQVGLVTPEGREFFAGCITVPLTHPERGTLSLYGRKISPRAQLRHLYLPGPKRGVLNWQGLQTAPEAVLVTESVLDALSAWVAGDRAATCVFGVSGVPQDLEEALRRFAVREVRLCLDQDAPGQKAAQALAERWAGLGVRCGKVVLPAGCKDPNQLLCDQGASALREALRQQQPFPGLEPPGSPLEPSPNAPDSLRWTWKDLAVTVTPHPPFRSRLRATLRVTRGALAYRHTLELSSFRARSQSARDLGLRFSLEPAQAEQFLLDLLEAVEGWVDTRQRPEEPASRRPAPPMSEGQRQEALGFLRRPDLIPLILKDMEAMGTVGEDRAKLLAYLIGVSRKLERPLAGILGSQSGAGKSGITERVADLTPDEDVVFFSRLSTLALYNMASDALQRKLVILEERVGAEAADYSIRTLLSQHRLVQAVTIRDPVTGKQRTQENEVLGPIAYLETTTNLRGIHRENATRCFEIHLDESEEQTRRIHQWQRQRRLARESLSKAQEAIRQRHQQAQRLLETGLVVRIPYVDRLAFPTRWLRTRRDHERFLCLIEAVAFLHQYQRPGGRFEDGTRFIDAGREDYRIAYDLAQEVLASTFHELSREARELLETIQEMLASGGPRRGLEDLLFTRRDVREHSQWTPHQVRTALEELREMEYVELTSGSQGRTCYFRLLPGASSGRLSPLRGLTTPEELESLEPDRP